MRILIDQSEYDLLNLGDVAMLQSCVARLREQWPAAEIMVITHDQRRLASYCPGTIAVRTAADLSIFRHLPRRARLISEQAWKTIVPYFSGRSGGHQISQSSHTAIQAVYEADLVVASGGAYVTDTWWWHAAGVLSLLSLAQRLGKPTAMFGQGIGPIGLRALRAQARGVLPGLSVLGLREDRVGRDLALSLGTQAGALVVTGDDALEMIGNPTSIIGDALGVSLRVSGYSGVDLAMAAMVSDLTLEMAATFNAPIVGLPVSWHTADGEILRRLFLHKDNRAGIVVDDLISPAALAAATAACRVVITGSYHAAVFGLAQGIPAVCLTKSPYYDAKFGGLQALFPDACFVVSLDEPRFPGHMRAALQQAWQLPATARITAKETAARLRDAGRSAYAQFRVAVEKGSTQVAADRQGGVAT